MDGETAREAWDRLIGDAEWRKRVNERAAEARRRRAAAIARRRRRWQ